ncbi:unnamed protein product [Caenorhabditis nigoni]
MQQFTVLVSFSLFASGILAQETSLSPVVHRFKRHCGDYGCGRSVCQECPSCCGERPFSPTFNINFNCCGAPRPSPACCPYVPPAPLPPPPPPAPSCCGPAPGPSPCCPPPPAPAAPCCAPPPPPPAPSPVVCCKQAPVPENPCCQVVAAAIPPAASAPACCVVAPVPSNPCCQPAPRPPPCTCSAPRPVPCRCAAPPVDCPNCDMPAPRCSMMSPMECSMRRMRRDTHQQILQHFHRVQ